MFHTAVHVAGAIATLVEQARAAVLAHAIRTSTRNVQRMGTSPKPTAWIGFGAIAVAVLAAAYCLGRLSAKGDNQPRSHQAVASKDGPDLRSALSAARNRLASCEEILQHRDNHLQKREGKPRTSEDIPTPPPQPEPSEQCIIASRAKELKWMSANCRDFRWQFTAYEEILGSSTLDCGTILSIRELAQTQYSICADVARSFEDTSQPDVTSDILGIDAMESAYMTKGEYGDVDINELVKNPACIARMLTE
ncbi:hypothetical protein [Sorangium sp. So ce1151]|uniref:hypothetical protein n=1 Tax=Sorangium sp. So ce1151 TaxID=3133332 RepID=UPI003F606713